MQLYSCTMQFANRLPFSQHLVPRYSKSLAVTPNFWIWGTAEKFSSSPQTLYQVSATADRWSGAERWCNVIDRQGSMRAGPGAARVNCPGDAAPRHAAGGLLELGTMHISPSV